MCGICGMVAPAGADRDDVERMSATLVHRGPDEHGVHVEGPAALAARRLSIIDLAHGHQPVATEDGAVTVVQNGEIYNHAELRAELERAGHRFASHHSDTEVIAHLYEEHGDGFAARLRGMFAVAIWDRRARRLVLARDRFGIKPLFYAEHDGGLAFASELRALEALPWFSRELDADALEAFLAFNSIPAPLTIFRAARKLAPGHLLRWEDGRLAIERFARPGPRPLRPDLGAEDVRDVLRDSVRAHLVADVPVGVLLSGGIDSSALCALAAQEGPAGLRTFSVGFEERSFDELGLARRVAQRWGTEHHEVVLRAADAPELLRAVAGAYDEPSGDSSALPTFLVSRLASEHVKVVLSGEGGDELFGGYQTYVADLLAARVGGPARLLSPLVERLPSGDRRVPLDYKLKRFTRAAHLPPLERHLGYKEIFSGELRAELLRGRRGADPLIPYRERWAQTEGAPLLSRVQDADLGIYLVDDLLVKTDRMSMHHSLEARVPFLDAAVADVAFALPVAQRVRGLATKRLLRRAVAPWLPEAVARGPKRGFSIPAAAWLRGPLVPLAREVLGDAPDGVVDRAVALRVLDDHVSGRVDLSRQLWGLISLSLWLGRARP
jgi:asparagine synthase (glutamine-hydrolysing)